MRLSLSRTLSPSTAPYTVRSRRASSAACHDCSEGGLAVAIAEMALGGDLGAIVVLNDMPAQGEPARELAFCESLGRLIIEVAPGNAEAFRAVMEGQTMAQIGEVRGDHSVIFVHDGQPAIRTTLPEIEAAFRGHLVEAA